MDKKPSTKSLRFIIMLCALVFLTGCSQKVSLSEDWTFVECNENFDNALEQIDKYTSRVLDKQKELAELERIGGYEKSADQLRVSISNLKQGQIAGNVQYIEEDVFGRCDKKQFTDEQLAKLDKAKILISQEETQLEAEGLPDVRVAQVKADFVPYEEQDDGSCSGPFMDMTFVVTNYGADLPRAVDLEKYNNLHNAGQVSTSPQDASLVSLSAELDFGNRRESVGTSGLRSEFDDGVFNSGESYTYEVRVPVHNNETSLKVVTRSGSGHALFASSKQGWDNPHQETFDIPIWDIYPQSSATIRSTDSSGKQTAETKLSITNLGKSATPGPVSAKFGVHNSETESSLALWSGQTFESLGPDAIDNILGDEKSVDEPLVDDILVKATVHLLCPSGQIGNLSDGDTSNNRRTLKTQ